jgi:hypothetical protein
VDESGPERLEDVLCDEGVVDSAVLVPVQRRDAVLADVSTHVPLPLSWNPRERRETRE